MAIKTLMPDAKIVLCRFHVATIFQNAMSKYCKTVKEKRDATKDLVRSKLMLYCKSEETFLNFSKACPLP